MKKLKEKNKSTAYKKIETKLYKFYNPDGSFEFDKCTKWILELIKGKIKE